MYQLRPGGTGGSCGAMFLDVLAPVRALACQVVCGQRLCLLWFGASEASQALGILTPPHQCAGTVLRWVSKMTQLEDGNVFWQALPARVCLKLQHFLSFHFFFSFTFFGTNSRTLLFLFITLYFTLRASDNGTDVSGSVSLDTLFVCLYVFARV